MPSSSKQTGLVLIGATSAIASAYARLAVQTDPDRVALFLIGRDPAALEEMAADLRARGAMSATTRACDLASLDDPAEIVAEGRDVVGQIDEALLAFGALPDQAKTEGDAIALRDALTVNFTSAAMWSQAVANAMAAQGSGRLAVIGSVAGDRGRMSNYAYGAAKGGLERFVEGLQHGLARLPDVSVTLVKPGFVRTPMTAHIENRDGLLWADPERVARDIRRAVEKRRRSLYTPWFWWLVMTVIRAVPAAILHKTKL